MSHGFAQFLLVEDLNKYLYTLLHLVNNENTPPKENPEYKLYKLGSLPETLSKTYQEYYTPEKELTIDEQMVSMNEVLYVYSVFQYIPKKPRKFGAKLWVLCESKSGYCSNI